MAAPKFNKDSFEPGQEVCVKINGAFVKAIYSEWNSDYDLPMVIYEGKKAMRKVFPMDRLTDVLQGKRSAVNIGKAHEAPQLQTNKTRFSVHQRFQFIEDLTDMVISGESKALIISGDGGLGKTFTVSQRLKAAGLKGVKDLRLQRQKEEEEAKANGWAYKAAGTEEEDEGEERDEEMSTDAMEPGDYDIVKGVASPKAIYRFLYENRNRIAIFDDCDSVWDDPQSEALIKAALDSYEDRWISWLSEMKGQDDLPQCFLFRGSAIFVSNLRLKQLPQPALSRCHHVDVSMTAQEKIDRIRELAPSIRKDMPKKQKEECLQLLSEFADVIGDLNIRTFLKVLEIRHGNKPHWRDLAEYELTAI